MFLSPMLLTKRETPFSDSRYLFEPKIDGHRLILSIQDGSVRLYTRHRTEVTKQYPELHDAPIADTTDVVLDGEVAYVDPETGAIDFETMMERFHLRKAEKIQRAMNLKPVHFFAFDILRYCGEDLRGKPLTNRKEILNGVLGSNEHFSAVLSVPGDGESLFQVVVDRDLEGIVAKRMDSVYVGKRDERWIKVINYTYADVVISGYRKGDFGWLAQFNGRPAGIIELAVPAIHKQAFYGVARGIKVAEDKNFVYLDPRIKARVRFRNWTRNGMLRTPEFVDFVV
ncbi:ATP-dependent DNA ligase [Cohnella nanjingensis]|uniref:ATP-dependent DNA ligase n=1 Tax=Cohnella nanjingensis TaxID=1387779 RepID=A0A7X0VDU1_9BACL|nr:RNA ligase family protein [Cohnella nanjingensis]MBB6670300.1 ATP-dependent DNA ligase [Cohnella nanjingensis]